MQEIDSRVKSFIDELNKNGLNMSWVNNNGIIQAQGYTMRRLKKAYNNNMFGTFGVNLRYSVMTKEVLAGLYIQNNQQYSCIKEVCRLQDLTNIIKVLNNSSVRIQ